MDICDIMLYGLSGCKDTLIMAFKYHGIECVMSNLKVIQFTLLLILLVTITSCKMRDDQEH